MLTTDEPITLSAEAVTLGQSIALAFSADSPGGKRVTKAERKALFQAALKLAGELGRDLVD